MCLRNRTASVIVYYIMTKTQTAQMTDAEIRETIRQMMSVWNRLTETQKAGAQVSIDILERALA